MFISSLSLLIQIATTGHLLDYILDSARYFDNTKITSELDILRTLILSPSWKSFYPMFHDTGFLKSNRVCTHLSIII